jgi:chorismate mutase
VHERLDVYHRVGKAKFLEDPAVAAQGRLAERIVDELRHEIDRIFATRGPVVT